jgi:hypothetical protein
MTGSKVVVALYPSLDDDDSAVAGPMKKEGEVEV